MDDREKQRRLDFKPHDNKKQIEFKYMSGFTTLQHIALNFCLHALYKFLVEKSENENKTHVIVECRGKREDDELEL